MYLVKRTTPTIKRFRCLRVQLWQCRCFSLPDHDVEIDSATDKAFQLLQHQKLAADQVQEAHDVLNTLNLRKATTPDSITASLRLLAFLGREGHPGDHFNGILHRWRSAKLFGEKVPNPRQIAQALRAFKHDVRSLGILASVQAWMAPVEMKHVALEQYMERIESRDMVPDVYMFHQLLRAWVISGHDDTASCLKGLLMRMDRLDYEATATEYAFLLRYWTNRYGENEMEAILELMEASQTKLNVECFSSSIWLFSELCKPWKAEYLLRDLMEQYPKCQWKIVWCVVRLIKSYTRSLEMETKHMQKATESVEVLSEDVLEMCKGDYGLQARVQGAVIDYYAEAGMCNKAYEVFKRIKRPSISEYCSLIRAFGRDDKAESGMRVLREIMPSRPLVAYHAALNAWLNSTRKSTGSQVRKVWRQLKHDGIVPRPETYLLLLEILSKWKGQSGYVERTFNEMKINGVVATRDSFHYAIQACVLSRDWKRCRSFLVRMSYEGLYPTPDTYSDHILPFCDPRRGEEVLGKMRGGLVNCDVYHSVIVKWMRKPSRESPDKVYGLYETMRQRGIKPDNETYSILISYFAKRDLPRTESLLNDLEDYDDIDADYSHYNPLMEAYLRSKQPRRAAVILLRRTDAYLRQQNHEDIMPLPHNIHDVFLGLIEADDLPAASWLLGRLHNMPLTLFEATYEMMMDAWQMSTSKDKKSRIGRIKSLLKDVEERKQDESKKPQKVSQDDAFAKAIDELDFESLF